MTTRTNSTSTFGEIGEAKKQKVIFYRPPDDIFGGRYYDYLFKPKDLILRQFFDVEIVHDHRSFINQLRRNEFAMIVLYLWAEGRENIYSTSLIRQLNRNSAPVVMLYATDAHSAGNRYVQHIAREIDLTAVLSCEPVVEAYFKFNAPTFYWMWSVDPDSFVNVEKTHDLFVSSRNSNRPGYYTWRCENGSIISNTFPNSLSSTHDAWPEYQRKLASCRFSFTCGSSNNTIVQKHLEIPFSGTCLITEETSLVRMMGFKDGENCVFGSGSLLMEKLDHLLKNPGLVSSIADAGRRLVLDKHTHAHRTQVSQLFNLIKNNEVLGNYYQPNPFGPIITKDGAEGLMPIWVVESPPRDLKAIGEWVDSDEVGKVQRYEELRSHLKEGHPNLLDAWANWVSNHGDLSLHRRTLREICLKVDGIPDYIVVNSEFATLYARTIQESKMSPLGRKIASVGLGCIQQGGSGSIFVAMRLFFILVGLWLLGAITVRWFFYFFKLFLVAYMMRSRTIARLLSRR